MNEQIRQWFDSHVDSVLASLPPSVTALLDEVPMHVDDRPSPELMRELGVRSPQSLCGLHSGVSLADRSVMEGARLPNVICIYREGLLAMCRTSRGIDEAELDKQIRITILHELGHYHGLDEDELSQLGYG